MADLAAREQAGERSDLPELEHATSLRTYDQADMNWFAILMSLLVVAFIVSLPLAGTKWMETQWGQLALFVTIAGAILLFQVWLLLKWSFWASWTTSNEGIAVRGPFRRTFVRWAEVEDAVLRRTRLPGGGGRNLAERWVLKTSQGSIPVPTHESVLAASVWQHLRSAGKAGKLALPTEAKVLWAATSVDAPVDVDYTNTRPPSVTIPMLKGVFLIVACVVLVAAQPHFWSIPGILVVIFVGGWVTGDVRRQCVVRRLSVRDDGFEAETTCGRMNEPWSAVESALLVRGSLTMQLRGRSVEVPTDGRPAELVPAVRHHLRAQKPPVLLAESNGD